MVPLNDKDLIIDLIKKFNVEVILVSRNYLGSINHTLLSVEALRSRNILIKGIIFNGESTPATESIIIKQTGLNVIGHIPILNHIDKKTIKDLCEKINLTF